MKIQFRQILIVLMAAILPVVTMVYQVRAAGPKVSDNTLGNKHNLSSLNTSPNVKYKAVDDTNNPRGQQICIFCHTPHNADVTAQAPLWNRKFTNVDSLTFQRYSTQTLQIRGIGDANYAQPNGSTKLCLSCHDGVTRLGDVRNGPEIIMANNSNIGDINVIEGLASFNPLTNKMKSGHHPVSFVYSDSVVSSINSSGLAYTTYKLPTSPPLGPPEVKLDKQNRMQCTTCHDPHQNQSFDDQCYGGTGNCVAPDTRKKAPFWVYGGGADATADQEAVCIACHPMIVPPWQPLP